MNKKDGCNHRYEDGTSAIVFSTKKWTGVYPKKVKGICRICKQQIELTESEYKELLKEGDLS